MTATMTTSKPNDTDTGTVNDKCDDDINGNYNIYNDDNDTNSNDTNNNGFENIYYDDNDTDNDKIVKLCKEQNGC